MFTLLRRFETSCFLGHSGCGKTSLVEAMAYLAGQTTRMGTVADGSTISDFDKGRDKASVLYTYIGCTD